jgi:hypothetical protein
MTWEPMSSRSPLTDRKAHLQPSLAGRGSSGRLLTVVAGLLQLPFVSSLPHDGFQHRVSVFERVDCLAVLV